MQSLSPSRIYINIEELSSKQRNAVHGLIKDLGFTTDEVKEVVVVIQESGGPDKVEEERVL